MSYLSFLNQKCVRLSHILGKTVSSKLLVKVTSFFIINYFHFFYKIYFTMEYEVVKLGIESLKSKVLKRISQESLKKDYQEIGTFIKKRRKDLNMTQDMISNGICSISYLSKIENNQIAPNAFFIKEIMSKLDIEEDFVNKNLEDQSYLQKTIQAVFYSNKETLDGIYQEIESIKDNVTINICKLGYHMIVSKKLSGDPLMRLEALIMNMNDLELKAYLLFSSLYFIGYNDYKTALEVLLMSFSIKSGNDYIDALTHEQTYYVKQRLLKKNSSLQHYDEAMRIYRKYFNNERTMKVTLHKIHYLCDENPKLALDQIDQVKVGLLSSVNKDYYYFLRGKISFLLQRFQECVGYLSHIDEDSSFHIEKLLLLYEIFIQENDADMQREVRNIISDYKMKRSDMKSKVYYHYLNETEEKGKKLYLRDIAIPFSIKSNNYRMLLFYTNKIMEICINNSRYKEATQYYKKCNREIKQVDQILLSV